MSKLHEFVGRQYLAVIDGIEETGNILLSKDDSDKISLSRKNGSNLIVFDPDKLYLEGRSSRISNFLVLSSDFYGDIVTGINQLSVGGTLIYKHFTPRIITNIDANFIYYVKQGEKKTHKLEIDEFYSRLWAYRYKPSTIKINPIQESSMNQIINKQPIQSPISKKPMNKYFKRLTLNDI